MYCRQCGTQLPDNAKFCGYCGTPTEQQKATESVAAPEPVVEVEPVVVPEPVVEVEPVVVPEPVVEVEPVVVPEPVVEVEPVVVPEPVVEVEPVVVPEPVVEVEPVVVSEPVVEVEPVVMPEPAAPTGETAAWEEPVNEMEWEAPASEEVWSDTADGTNWGENNANETWSDTWSETAQTSGWNLQNVSEVPLIIEPKKKSTGLTIFTIIGIVALTALVVICAILMNGGSSEESYDDFWSAEFEDEYLEDFEDELEDAFDEYADAEEEVGNGAIMEEESSAVPTSVTLSCGVEIPFDAPSADLSGMAVSDLYGIEQCTMLQSLRINGGGLTDLSPLAGLAQLNSLTLNNVPVSDIQVLKNLPNLMYLDITDTQVSAQQVKELRASLPNLVVIGYTTSTYEITKKDCTWVEAVDFCAEKGGHLVTISDKAEMEKVEALLKDTDLKYFWMGGYSQGDTWYWITGETWGGYVNWFPGEPSKQDTDGTLEDCLCLWNVDDNGWTMNDQRNDLPSFTSTQGKIGYICEYEAIAGYQE